MPKINPYLIPKENYKKVEEVREIDDKYEIPSYEEFMKNYKADEKVSESYETEIDSYSDVSKEKGHGPCSYWGCSQPSSVPFSLEIYIEGCKWWARNPNKGTDLPGTWTWSPTSSYLWRNDLWLTHIGHAWDADRLIGENNLYTVNTVGAYAWEDCEFCRGTQNLIRECISLHKKGYGIQENRTLPSSTTRWTKWGVKVTAGVVSAATLNPVGAIAVGASTWGTSKVIQEICSSDKSRHAWGIVSDVGSETFKGGVISGAFGVASSSLTSQATKGIGHTAAREIACHGRQMTNGAKFLINTGKTISTAQKFYEVYDKYETYIKPGEELEFHAAHQSVGISYFGKCAICNPK